MPEVELRWWRGSQKFHEGYTTGDGITAPPGLQDALDDLLPPGGTIEADLEREVSDESRFFISQ